MANYPSETVLDWFGTTLAGVSVANGDSFTPLTVSRRSRAPDDGHQDVPSITYWLEGPGGGRAGSIVSDALSVAVQIVLSGQGVDSPEAAVNQAREDVLAAIFNGWDEGVLFAEIESHQSSFLWDVDSDETDLGVQLTFQVLIQHSVGDWRTAGV